MSKFTEDRDSILHATIESAVDSLDKYIDVSHGTPSMSPEDVKSALVMTHRALQYQTLLNESLLQRIADLETRGLFNRR